MNIFNLHGSKYIFEDEDSNRSRQFDSTHSVEIMYVKCKTDILRYKTRFWIELNMKRDKKKKLYKNPLNLPILDRVFISSSSSSFYKNILINYEIIQISIEIERFLLLLPNERLFLNQQHSMVMIQIKYFIVTPFNFCHFSFYEIWIVGWNANRWLKKIYKVPKWTNWRQTTTTLMTKQLEIVHR